MKECRLESEDTILLYGEDNSLHNYQSIQYIKKLQRRELQVTRKEKAFACINAFESIE